MADPNMNGTAEMEPLERIPDLSAFIPSMGGDKSSISYSDVLDKERQIKLDAIFDFLRDHRPDSMDGRNGAMNLAGVIAMEMKSPGLRYQERLKSLQDREENLRQKLASDEIREIEGIFASWHSGCVEQEYLACRKHLEGMEALYAEEPAYEELRDQHGRFVCVRPQTEGPRWKWYSAVAKMQEADQQARLGEFGANAYELYQAMCRQALLRREMNEAVAKRVTIDDLSEWSGRLQSGQANTTDRIMGGPVLMMQLLTFVLAHDGKDNYWRQHMEKMFQASVTAMYGRRRRGGSADAGDEED